MLAVAESGVEDADVVGVGDVVRGVIWTMPVDRGGVGGGRVAECDGGGGGGGDCYDIHLAI